MRAFSAVLAADPLPTPHFRCRIRTCRSAIYAVLLVSLAGCGGTDSTTDPPVATTLTLSSTTLSFSSLGETQQLTATVRDQTGATMIGASVAWASSASSVASVSSTGLVTALADGPATITATSGSANGTASVTVEQVAASVTLSPSLIVLVVLTGPGATATVTASVTDAGGSAISNPSLTWSSNNLSVATVDANGLVTAVSGGLATITVVATGGGGTIQDQVAVTVLDLLQGLIVFYLFNGDATDESGNGNHGTLLGGATAATALTIGFNAVDRLEVPSVVANGLGDFTVAMWVRLDGVQHSLNDLGLNTLASGFGPTDDNSFLLYYGRWLHNQPLAADGFWAIALASPAAPIGFWRFPTDERIEDLTWHHVVFVREGGVARNYFDGVQSGADVAVSAEPTSVVSGGLFLGQDQDVLGGGFVTRQSLWGQLDNFRIYSRALSIAEVQVLSTEAR